MTALINYTKQHKKLLLLGLFLTIFFVLFYVEPALAQATPPAAAATPATTTETTIAQGILAAITWFLKALNRLLLPLIMMIGGLMDNEILFGGGMQERLLSIWVQIRNIVNVIFVIALVAIAIYNVLGIGGEGQYQLKTILPKFIVGLIAVNFSFLILKVTLDAINVGTTSMFGLPQTISTEVASLGGKDGQTKLGRKICQAISVKLGAEQPKDELCTGGASPQPKKELLALLKQWSSKNAAMVLALQMMNMAELDKIPEKIEPTFEKLTINILFSLVLYLVYGSSIVALFIVLIIRLIVLWLGLALSPLIIIRYVFPNLIDQIGGGELQEKFIQTAIAPMIIGFVLSVGYIMLDAFRNITFIENPEAPLSFLMKNTMELGLPTSGLATFQDLIVAVATVGFVWAGVMAALSKTVGSGITTGLMNAAKGAGTWIAAAPFKYTPLMTVKTPGGDKVPVSFATALGGIKQLKYLPERAAEEQGAKLFGIKSYAGRSALETGTFSQGIDAIKENKERGVLKDSIVENMKKHKGAWEALSLNLSLNTAPGVKNISELSERLREVDETEAGKIMDELVRKNQTHFAGAVFRAEEAAKPAAAKEAAKAAPAAPAISGKEAEDVVGKTLAEIEPLLSKKDKEDVKFAKLKKRPKRPRRPRR